MKKEKRKEEIVNEVKSTPKADIGLDRTTRWIIVTGLAAVFIGAGMGAIHRPDRNEQRV
jgi:hypothetical protein